MNVWRHNCWDLKMIRLDRNKTDENGQEISPSPGWFQRAGAARDDAVRQGRQHEFLASIYSAREVRASLSAISSDKCAYCEYRLSRTDWDVDHYRPKARVYGRDDHPGYYWLAYEWDNLLPACKHCNQLRSDPPTLGNLGRTRGRGKGDKFPPSGRTIPSLLSRRPNIQRRTSPH